MTSPLLNQAVSLYQKGQSGDAERLFRQVLAAEPGNDAAWYYLGLLCLDQGQGQEALAAFDKVIRLNPGNAETWNNRGIALQMLGRHPEAIESYGKALAARPDYAEAANNRGTSLHSLKRHDEALASFDKALVLKPNYVRALYYRGITLRDMGRFAEALAAQDRALAAGGESSEILSARGVALWDMDRLDEALVSLDRAVQLDPRNAEAWNHRGGVLALLRRYDEALASFDSALTLDPSNVQALRKRGTILWTEKGRYAEALRDNEKAFALEPDYKYLRGDLFHLRMHGADWRDYESEVSVLTAGVHAGKKIVLPFILQAISQSPADLKACAEIHAPDYDPPMPVSAPPGPWPGHSKIRLGYVSGEFRDQATAHLTTGLYEAHDKSRFELVAFDNGFADKSLYRQRLENAFDRFIDISKLSHDQAADAVRAQEIDILVNLNGYFGTQRTEVFARRPAPVQVNYLGFPGTMGVAYMDYILADRFVIPRDDARHYSEAVAWLPDSYQINDDKRRIASASPGRAQCGLPAQGFVFCNFNQGYKLTPPMFASWMRILKAVDGSVLWLLENRKTPMEENLRREAHLQGVDAGRLVFAPYLGMEEHLARLRLGDLFLDSVPCNAHTTASDALWAGLPLLTLEAGAFSGRVAASLLNATGLPELVTNDMDGFETMAIALAREPVRLANLRQRLRDNRLSAPLFDTARTTRHIEAAYTRMWELSQRGEKPQSFTVPPSP